MLEVHSYTGFNKMPVDFGPYLLSASPPAFRTTFVDYCNQRTNYSAPHGGSNPKQCSKLNRKYPSPFKLKGIIIGRDRDVTSPGSTGEQSDGLSSPESPLLSPSKNKKKVSFADNNGLALVSVKVMTEPSDMPPKLDKEIMQSVTHGASAGVTDVPPLLLEFAQPASDYLKFREKLENNNVSLENVVVKDYSFMGTVKVKNICFEKKVWLRVTFDSWESSTDVHATYVPSGNNEQSRFETFSFQTNVPTNSDLKKKIQFAVCYQAGSEEFWDNNNSANYTIVSSFSNPTSSRKKVQELSEINSNESWTEFSSWSRLDTSLPYW